MLAQIKVLRLRKRESYRHIIQISGSERATGPLVRDSALWSAGIMEIYRLELHILDVVLFPLSRLTALTGACHPQQFSALLFLVYE